MCVWYVHVRVCVCVCVREHYYLFLYQLHVVEEIEISDKICVSAFGRPLPVIKPR